MNSLANLQELWQYSGNQGSWGSIVSARTTVLVIQGIYVVIASVIMTLTVGAPGITGAFLLVAMAALWNSKRMMGIIVDLAPFLALIVCYEDLREYAHKVTPFQIHVNDLAGWERFLFHGTIPSAWLQAHIHSGFIFIASDIAYGMHFIYPVVFAVILWSISRSDYWRFLTGLTALTYVGFLCYLIFPSAPPWWASHYGYLREHIEVMGIPTSLMLQTPNPVAAFPSLHGAYSAFVAMYAIHKWKKHALWTLAIPVAVAFATVMLGHHYVVDLLAGYVLAAAAFLLARSHLLDGIADMGSLYELPSLEQQPALASADVSSGAKQPIYRRWRMLRRSIKAG